METQLNTLLADLVVEYHKLQNFHWYVKGKDFFTAHAKLEELYDGINNAIDEVAENILMIDGSPAASLKDFMALSSLQEADRKHRTSAEVFTEVLADFKQLLTSVKMIKKTADAKEEYLISALMDEYIKQFTKSIWMISQLSVS